MKDKHNIFMRECLHLAKQGEGKVSPNPLVGAVLVRDGKIIGRGYHRRFGGPHAEVECIEGAKGPVAGTTMYVNLEPCSHHGKTPPCADLIIRSGIREVIIAIPDPNPRVGGRGIRRLKKAGVLVRAGVLAEEARELNREFLLHVTRRRPYVHVKIAQTLNGIIASGTGRPRWISSKESRALVHRWRAKHDAVLVGVGTVLADDPELTVRHQKGRHPAIVVLDGRLQIPEDAALFGARREVFIVAARAVVRSRTRKVKKLQDRGVTLLAVEGKPEKLDLFPILKSLYREKIGSILVEGGREVFSQFLLRGPVDQLSVFVAPKILGSGVPSFVGDAGSTSTLRFSRWSASPVGRDILIQAFR